MTASPSVTHNEIAGQFETETGSGLALLRYVRRDSAIDLVHTEVPAEEEGAGYGTALASAALGYAREMGLRVIPSCAFVRHFLDGHHEYAGLVAES